MINIDKTCISLLKCHTQNRLLLSIINSKGVISVLDIKINHKKINLTMTKSKRTLIHRKMIKN